MSKSNQSKEMRNGVLVYSATGKLVFNEPSWHPEPAGTVDIRGTASERASKLQAVSELRECDHAFMSADGVAKFASAFGVSLKPTKHYADYTHPKGLYLKNGAKSAVGMDASVMATLICDQLGVAYPRMMGRGFQLRVCCNALEKHFSDNTDNDPLVRHVRNRHARGLKSGF